MGQQRHLRTIGLVIKEGICLGRNVCVEARIGDRLLKTNLCLIRGSLSLTHTCTFTQSQMTLETLRERHTHSVPALLFWHGRTKCLCLEVCMPKMREGKNPLFCASIVYSFLSNFGCRRLFLATTLMADDLRMYTLDSADGYLRGVTVRDFLFLRVCGQDLNTEI